MHVERFPFDAATVAQGLEVFGETVVVRHDHPAFTRCYGLSCLEAEGARSPMISSADPIPAGPVPAGGVLYDRNVVSGRDRPQSISAPAASRDADVNNPS